MQSYTSDRIMRMYADDDTSLGSSSFDVISLVAEDLGVGIFLSVPRVLELRKDCLGTIRTARSVDGGFFAASAAGALYTEAGRKTSVLYRVMRQRVFLSLLLLSIISP